MSLYSARSPPIHQSHVFGRFKISQTIFEKGHPRNIPVKLFQIVTFGFEEEDFFKEFLHVHIEQETPIHQSHVYGRIKISRTVFEKGHLRNIPVISKSDQGFRRRFFMNFFHVHIVQEAPIHQSHVYGWIKIWQTLFEKGHPRNIPVKLF